MQSPSSPAPSTDVLLAELRENCHELRKLINSQRPTHLIGYLWSMVLLSLMSKSKEEDDSLPPVTGDESEIIIAMEYVHAVISTDGIHDSYPDKLDSRVGDLVIERSKRILSICFQIQMISGLAEDNENYIESLAGLKFRIFTSWVAIRGKRFQCTEEEFFKLTLSPHTTILQEKFGVSSDQIAAEIQRFADNTRFGMADATESLTELLRPHGLTPSSLASSGGIDLNIFSPSDQGKFQNAIADMFYGEVFNISSKTDLDARFLSAVCTAPGSVKDFFDDSPHSGTPYQTLPCKIKPLTKIGDDYYCTDPNHFRDTMYRAVQRALIECDNNYRKEWNDKQKSMSEHAFVDLMSEFIHDSEIYFDAYYKVDGRWCETDCVIICDDVLITLEVKAGSEALRSPAANLKQHTRKVDQLIGRAYEQARRFIEDADTSHNGGVRIFQKEEGGNFREKTQIKFSKFRKVYPIGLTVESFTPFSATFNERQDVTAISDQHDFISMSIDDLIAIKHVLRSCGELMHYFDVRQQMSSIREAFLFDEMDHLGAYVSNNRIDQTAKERLQNDQLNGIWFDGFDLDVLGPYFSDPDWPNVIPPSQPYPEHLSQLLSALDEERHPGWLEGDNCIRDMGSEGREQFEALYKRTAHSLRHKGQTYFLTGGGVSNFYALSRSDGIDRSLSARRQAEVATIALGGQKVVLFELILDPGLNITHARSTSINPPSALRNDYGQILRGAEEMRAKMQQV